MKTKFLGRTPWTKKNVLQNLSNQAKDVKIILPKGKEFVDFMEVDRRVLGQRLVRDELKILEQYTGFILRKLLKRGRFFENL